MLKNASFHNVKENPWMGCFLSHAQPLNKISWQFLRNLADKETNADENMETTTMQT